MIRKSLNKIVQKIGTFHFSVSNNPVIFGKGRSAFSLSQLWNGVGQKPFDYFVEDKLEVELDKQWNLENGLFRVIFSACLNDSSMNININHLKKSATLNRLIQLQASEKERLVDNPSTVIIKPNLKIQEESQENQISRNILQLDKLFQNAVGLKMSYLIDESSYSCLEYLQQLRKRDKAISADVVTKGMQLEQLIFKNGYKLEHVFLDGTTSSENQTNSLFRYQYDLRAVIQALSLIDFKGKLILPGGSKHEAAIEAVTKAAKNQSLIQKPMDGILCCERQYYVRFDCKDQILRQIVRNQDCVWTI